MSFWLPIIGVTLIVLVALFIGWLLGEADAQDERDPLGDPGLQQPKVLAHRPRVVRDNDNLPPAA